VEIGGIQNIVRMQVVFECKKKEHDIYIFLDGSVNSTANFLCLTTNRSNNCSILSLPPEEYFE